MLLHLSRSQRDAHRRKEKEEKVGNCSMLRKISSFASPGLMRMRQARKKGARTASAFGFSWAHPWAGPLQARSSARLGRLLASLACGQAMYGLSLGETDDEEQSRHTKSRVWETSWLRTFLQTVGGSHGGKPSGCGESRMSVPVFCSSFFFFFFFLFFSLKTIQVLMRLRSCCLSCSTMVVSVTLQTSPVNMRFYVRLLFNLPLFCTRVHRLHLQPLVVFQTDVLETNTSRFQASRRPAQHEARLATRSKEFRQLEHLPERVPKFGGF